jgi:hypothetical protein
LEDFVRYGQSFAIAAQPGERQAFSEKRAGSQGVGVNGFLEGLEGLLIPSRAEEFLSEIDIRPGP